MSSRELLYEKGMDGTAATFITDYILVAQMLIQAIALLFQEKPLSFDMKNRTYLAVLFFILQAITYLAGGITHQYYPHSQDYAGTPAGFYVFWSAVLIFSQLGFYVLLLFIGPITECCCCRTFSNSEGKQWRLYAIITFIISLPVVIVGLVTLTGLYFFLFQLIVGFYFTAKSVMNLKNGKAAVAEAEYFYISCGVLILVSGLWYFMIAEGCSTNEDGYSNNPNDDNYCVLPLQFNHNAVIHVVWNCEWFILFCGVWLEASATRGKGAQVDLETGKAEMEQTSAKESANTDDQQVVDAPMASD